MTLDEIQHEVMKLSDDERLRLRAYLLHLSRVNTEGNRQELSRLKASVKAGNYLTQEEVESAHVALVKEAR